MPSEAEAQDVLDDAHAFCCLRARGDPVCRAAAGALISYDAG
jgi:hypothetical protein